MRSSIAYGVAGVWAGVCLGGSIIAAPAKFGAPSLTQPVALEVGRAQFLWIGITEAVLWALLIICLVLTPNRKWIWALLASILFGVQRLAVMPALDARTLDVIAGNPVEPNSLHTIYIGLEISKFLVLTGMAVGLLPLFKGTKT